ncbi:MAG: hypothetical protein EAZ60_25760 [Oscillatoriales cyanobacterium]|nr:MAG: hypothetical protein EAZ60_25760 [Oscillatoriales cyanobacterium]
MIPLNIYIDFKSNLENFADYQLIKREWIPMMKIIEKTEHLLKLKNGLSLSGLLFPTVWVTGFSLLEWKDFRAQKLSQKS